MKRNIVVCIAFLAAVGLTAKAESKIKFEIGRAHV